MDTIDNAAGCDSIITINLTVVDNKPIISQTNQTLTVDLDSLSYQWYACNNGLVKIRSATGKSFVPANEGKYTVIVDESGCSDTAECYDFFITNLKKGQVLGLQLYPNPNKGVFTIKSNVNVVDVRVYNSLGKMVYQSCPNSLSYQVEKFSGSEGIYLVQVKTDFGIINQFVQVLN